MQVLNCSHFSLCHTQPILLCLLKHLQLLQHVSATPAALQTFAGNDIRTHPLLLKPRATPEIRYKALVF